MDENSILYESLVQSQIDPTITLICIIKINLPYYYIFRYKDGEFSILWAISLLVSIIIHTTVLQYSIRLAIQYTIQRKINAIYQVIILMKVKTEIKCFVNNVAYIQIIL